MNAQMQAKWRAIEAEYGEPVADVIRHFREDGCSWATIAGALGVHRTTLRKWRGALGLSVDGERSALTLEYPRPSYCKARDAGFATMMDAIRHYRLVERLTGAETAARLGVSRVTISQYTPVEIKGMQMRRDYANRRADR